MSCPNWEESHERMFPTPIQDTHIFARAQLANTMLLLEKSRHSTLTQFHEFNIAILMQDSFNPRHTLLVSEVAFILNDFIVPSAPLAFRQIDNSATLLLVLRVNVLF